MPLIAATILTGVLAGLGAVAFHFLADVFGGWLFEHGATLWGAPHVVLIPAAGLLLVGLVLQRVPDSRFGGVREVLEALERGGGVVPMVRGLNVILSGLVLAFGGSVGPEGPMVQLGALAGSVAGQRCRLNGTQLINIVRAGAAAGIAASFRSTAGGVFLAVEIFGARIGRDLITIVVAAAIGFVLRISLLGDAAPFRPRVPMQPLPLAGLLLIAPLMGLAAAPAGHVFIRIFERIRALFPLEWPLALRVALGGVAVGVIGIGYPQVMSAGYGTIHRSVDGGMAVSLFATLLVLKMLATSITFGSGAVGGLFAPTLVMGALFGGAFGYGLHAVVPELAPQPELLVLIGMVAIFSSIIKCYWSGLFMVADLSGCYLQLLPPGAIAGAVSYFLSWRIYERSIFGLSRSRSTRSQ